MTTEAALLVTVVLPDARRLGLQLRMNHGGAYLNLVRRAVTVLQERSETDTDQQLRRTTTSAL